MYIIIGSITSYIMAPIFVTIVSNIFAPIFFMSIGLLILLFIFITTVM